MDKNMVEIQVICQIHRVDSALSYDFSLGGPNFGMERLEDLEKLAFNSEIYFHAVRGGQLQ